MSIGIAIHHGKLTDFCHKWKITELAVFGSILREDFQPDSDVDVLVTFTEDSRWSLLDVIRAQRELSDILGRKVDLLEREAVEQSENWIWRKAILSSAETIYVAR